MLSKCCCCIPLRTGCIILAVLGILSGIGMLIKGYSDWPYVIEAIVSFAASGPLLFGAIQNNQRAVLVGLIADALLIVFSIVFGIIAIASVETVIPELANNCDGIPDFDQLGVSCDDFKSTMKVTVAAAFVVGGLFNIYFWICIYSFYAELKTTTNNPASIA